MTTNDPIADMLTRIRNANTAKHDTVDIPASKMKRLINLRNELRNVKENAKKEFYDNVEKNWNECPGLDKEFEAKCIYRDKDSPDEVFEHLNNIKINDKTMFLFNPNITGYRR